MEQGTTEEEEEEEEEKKEEEEGLVEKTLTEEVTICTITFMIMTIIITTMTIIPGDGMDMVLDQLFSGKSKLCVIIEMIILKVGSGTSELHIFYLSHCKKNPTNLSQLKFKKQQQFETDNIDT